jgi:hypothetical protein
MNSHFSPLARAGIVSLLLSSVSLGWAGALFDKNATSAGNFESSKFRYGVNIRQGWDSNARTRNSHEQSSAFTSAGVTVDTTIGNARTNLTLGLGAGVYYYWDIDEEDDLSPDIRLSIRASHAVTPRFNLSLSSYLTYQMEPDFYSSLSTSRRSGNYFYSNNVIGATYLWTPRFSTVTSYSFVAVVYEDSVLADVEDRTEHIFSQEFRYLLFPQTTVLAEYRLGLYEYERNDVDSISNYFLLGLEHNFTPRLRVAARGGVEIRDFDIQGTETAPYGELSLAYQYRRGSSIEWSNRFGFEQSDLIGDQTNLSFRTGLRVNHAITGKLSAILGAYYKHSDYEFTTSRKYVDPLTGEVVVGGPRDEFVEETIDLNIGLRYALRHNLILDTGYTFTTVSSDEGRRDYDRHRVYLGLSATF